MDKHSDPPAQPSAHRWFGFAYLLIFVAGAGFFLLSFVALGVLPGMRLADTIAAYSPTQIPDYTAAERRGRHLYTSLGCALCHTQQVRFLRADAQRWGAATEAWETRYDFPQLWGTRRIGPDLAREAGVRSDDWQLTHLYNPRWVVPDSVMPAFDWLFEGRPDRPSAAASDLLAYLHTLGRARQSLSEKNAGTHIDPSMTKTMQMEIENLSAPFINPNQARVDNSAPHSMPARVADDRSSARGGTLFAQNCAGCHGVNGDGNGLAAPGLSPKPANLRQRRFSTAGLMHILWNGRAGSAMPAWREFSAADLASLTAYVQTLHPAPTDAPQPAAAILARGAAVYAGRCLRCHGAQGQGNGPESVNLLPRPANLSGMQIDTARVIQVLDEGVPGTSMPPWPDITPADKQALSSFVRSLFELPGGQNP